MQAIGSKLLTCFGFYQNAGNVAQEFEKFDGVRTIPKSSIHDNVEHLQRRFLVNILHKNCGDFLHQSGETTI